LFEAVLWRERRGKVQAKLTDPDTGKEVYMNKKTGNFTSVRPATYNENQAELAEFETVVAEDGSTYTVRTNDDTGNAEYMDWDTGRCGTGNPNSTGALSAMCCVWALRQCPCRRVARPCFT
jgi:hypothetical protein